MENTVMKTMTTEETKEETLADQLLGATEEMAETEEIKTYTRPNFWKDNRGVGVIEIVLILVILIGLVLVFKEQITDIVNDAFASISGDAGKIIN